MPTAEPVKPTSFWRECAAILSRARQMWGLIPARQRWTLGGGVVLMALGGASNTAIPLLLGKLVDTASDAPVRHNLRGAIRDFFTGEIFHVVGLYLALIAGAYLFRELLQVGRRFLVEETCTRLEKHLFVSVVSHLLMIDLSTLSHDKVGSLHGRILRSVDGSVRFLRVGFLDFLPALVVGGFALAAVFAKQPWLGAVMLGVIPISVLITVRQLNSQKGVRLKLLACREDMDGTVVEQLGGIDYIRVANTHGQEINRVRRAAETLRSNELRHYFVMSLYGSSKALIEGLFHVLVVGAAVFLAATGRVSPGDILTFSMLFLSVMGPLAEIHRMIDEGHESSLLVGELLKILAEPIDRCYEVSAGQTPVLNGKPAIEVHNLAVDYAMGEGDRRRALEGVSLTILPGEIIGIAGRSGCGKSTLLRALLRLVHPADGQASLGGVPLDALDRDNMAHMLGYVGQTPFVFSSTIRENIAYERGGATDEEVHRAAQLACLEEEIMKIPGGFEALISERGGNLSGGQKQRLALARVFLKDPPILILDEATSALDTISEGKIQEWLNASRGHRTVILVAHRLSTLLHTDRIFVFDQGRIAESGTYDELVAKGGVFSQLVASAGNV